MSSSESAGAGASLPLEALGQILERLGDEVLLVSVATGRIVHANRAACRLLGLRHRDLVGRPIDAIDPELGDGGLDRIAETLRAAAHGSTTLETVHHGAEGRSLWVELSLSRISFDEEDFYLCVGRDLGARRTAEAELRRRSEELLRVFEGIGAGVCVIDVEHDRLLVANATARERFGPAGGPHCCRNAHRSAGVCPCAGTDRCACEDSRTPLMWEFESPTDGRRYWSIARAVPWFDGRKVCIEATIDVTERRRLEEEHARLMAAVAQAAEAIFVTDRDGRIVYVSPAFERVTGWPAGEARGQTPRILKSGEHDAGFYEEMWRSLVAGEVFRGRLTNRRRDGSHYDADLSISPVRDAAGAIVNFVAVQRDVTREVEYESLVRQTHKLKAVGTLAGGVSHEFNNLLQAVLGYTSIVRDSLPPDDLRREDLGRVLDAAERGASLAESLEAFARGTPATPQAIDLRSLVRESTDRLAAAAPPAVRYRVEIPETVALVRGDADRVRDLLLNLCTNAVDALPRGGVVRVTLDEVVLERPLQTVIRELPSGRYVRLCVEDDGVGMDREELAQLFDPFYTRKRCEPGERHRGLGLPIVYGILQSWSGGIRVRSRQGEGTRVEVYLPPLVAGPSAQPSPPAPRDADREGPRTVLVVDDEPDNVELARVVLARAGFRVLTAADGIQALAAFDQEPAAVDLVLLDIVMPRMDGAETFRRLRQRAPALPVVFATGYDVEDVARDVRDGGASFLFKPYRPKDLVDRVAAALASRRGA